MENKEYFSIQEEWPCLQHRHCKYFKVNADREESTCKRIDHKHIKFAKPYFKSYDCGQFQAGVCKDFTPAKVWKWLYKNWTSYEDYFGKDFVPKGTIALCVNDDSSTRYHVKFYDFVNNCFMDKDGNPNWVYKQYYKRTKTTEENPIGYILTTEENPNYKE